MKPIRTLFLIMIVGILPAWSEQAPRLTLQTALDLADKQNLDLAAARRRRAVSAAGVQIARQRPNPTFNFSATRDFPHEGVFFDQPLEIGGKRRRRIELAHQEGALTEVEIAALSRQVRRNVREAYFTVALAHAESERRAQVLKLASRLKQIAQERFEAGAVAQLEVIQADLGVSRTAAAFQVAQQQEKVALSQLNALLNEPLSRQWEVAGALEDLPHPVALADLIQRAEVSNAELQRLAQEQKLEQSRRSLLKAERVPNLGLEFGTDFNSPGEFRAGPRTQLSVVLPVFTRNQGEIAQSMANQRVLEATTTATRRAVAGRVEAAYFELVARQSQVELHRQTLLPAAQRLETLAEESYRAGKSPFLTVLDAQRNVQEVQRDYLGSLFALQSAFAELEATVGTPLE